METNSSLHETVLADFHVAHGARMVPFAGGNMPVQYADGIKAEHLATRNAAGLFERLAPAPQACHLPAGKKHPRSGEIGNCPAMVECLQIPPRFHPRAMALFGPAGTKSHLRDEPCSRHYEKASNRQS